jgi:hypothetical protein
MCGKTKLRGSSPQANYTYRTTAACLPNYCQEICGKADVRNMRKINVIERIIKHPYVTASCSAVSAEC